MAALVRVLIVPEVRCELPGLRSVLEATPATTEVIWESGSDVIVDIEPFACAAAVPPFGILVVVNELTEALSIG